MQLEGVVTVGMTVAIVATTTALAPAITPSVYTRIGDVTSNFDECPSQEKNFFTLYE
ncbi:transmembrane protein, putative [Medicago truncatula]|uniref:Transmembrane protein, putative n=1 Tax=Medicago truncatula TaxID=3880 RepID=A0A072UF46_MEDTR|nr:transmembrane protein, putative [Medicago truncatula]